MKQRRIEIYSDEADNSVVRIPNNPFPAAVIQGDSLFLRHGEAMDLVEELKHNPGSDSFYRAFRVASDLEQRLRHYIDVCEAHDIELNFDIVCSVEDYRELLFD